MRRKMNGETRKTRKIQGKWITAPQSGYRVKRFFKPFLVEGDVGRADLHICGLGYFKAMVNGHQLDDCFYQPLVTDYNTRENPENSLLEKSRSHRVTYYTYDIRRFLKPGENILEVDVANGYYEDTDRLTCEMDYSFGTAKLIYDLQIQDAQGEKVIGSDTDTLVREQNYRSTLYVGDRVDFSEEPGAYQLSVLAKEPDGELVEPACEPDRVIRTYEPVEVREIEAGTLYDFGVNHSGGLKLILQGQRGDRITLRYAEVLGEDGMPNYETSAWHDAHPKTGATMDIYQENHYVLAEGRNEIQPLFSWFAYRYVLLEKPAHTTVEKIESLFISMDLEKDGHFTCSEDVLVRTNEMFEQTLRCNMHSGLLTDCPHREKRPYTGDGQLVMKAAYYNGDVLRFYDKWFRDLLDSQTEAGRIPNTAPDFGGGGGYAWGNALCSVTKNLYCLTGEEAILKEGYPAICRWLEFYERHTDADGVIRSNDHDWMLGDWLAPDTVTSNLYYINTVCYYMALDVAQWIAKICYKDEAPTWEQKKQALAEAVNRVFFDEKKLQYGNGVQGEDVLALATGIVPEAYEKALQEKVRHHYSIETEYHLDAGIVIMPIMLNYLTEHGMGEIAYKMMTTKTYPSFYQLMEGDTTFAEHWSKHWPDYYYGNENSRFVKGGGDLSHCHPMYGSVCSWMYERVAGLDLFSMYRKEMGIHPYFTDCLTEAKADKMTAYGKAEVAWRREGERLLLHVQIPKELTGKVVFPSSYKMMKNKINGETYQADEEGRFDFTLSSGTWELIAEKGGAYDH